jgi:hypothetical protein
MQKAYDETMRDKATGHARVGDFATVGRTAATENMIAAPSDKL